VLPASTGVIGWQLPMDKIRSGMSGINSELAPGRLAMAAHAIMTTDTHAKFRSAAVGSATLFGMVKGSGMIEPNLATMLAFFFTDAKIPAATLDLVFKRAVDLSFNRISVDSDTSTSDTVAILANGLAGVVDHAAFEHALTELATDLAKDIVRYGEGATKLIEVRVAGARSVEQARRIAKLIVNSPLVKTAVYGCDPNWGRVAMAVGKSYDPDVDPSRVRIGFGELILYDGRPVEHEKALESLRDYLASTEVRIFVDLGVGRESATVWGCDLTEQYIHINASYTS
ncbi:MAG: bifunctional glutamate N-acetyltransferase/amino-acid acetyltransferase ArgJ, partial [Methylococcales bacterium]